MPKSVEHLHEAEFAIHQLEAQSNRSKGVGRSKKPATDFGALTQSYVDGSLLVSDLARGPPLLSHGDGNPLSN